jgi:hypothetical protein
MKKFSLIIVLIAGLSSIGFAQSRVGTSAAPFLTMGNGAKALALGHANTVNTSGAEALFWNPAGISIQNEADTRSSGFLSSNQHFVDVNTYTTGLVLPLGNNGKKNFGFGINFVDYGRQLVRTEDQPEGTGATFGAHDLSIGLTYAQNLTDNFHFGGTAKFIQQKIYDMTAETIAFDFGFILKTDFINGLSLGASINNFGGKMQMDGINSEYFIDIDETTEANNTNVPARVYTDKWDIPLSFKVGVVVPVIKQENLQWLMLSEAQQTNDNDLNIDSGTQLSYLTKTVKFHTRAGYKDLLLGSNVDSHFSYGAGFTLKTSTGIAIGVDFAQVPFEYLGQTTIVDLKLYF